MRKSVFILFFGVLCIYSFSQTKRNAMCDYINQEEALLLNNIASTHGLIYDFTLKKVAFYTGSGGGARTNKHSFLSECDNIKKYYPDAIAPMTQIIIFDNEEKSKADGYDAVIVYGSVKQFPSKKALIRRLHKFRLFK